MENKLTKDYKDWIIEVKQKVRSAQIKAAIAVNTALITFYWDLGKMIEERQTAYGTGFISQLSKDLKEEFPELKGFSVRNLALCRSFYQFYSSSNLQQPVANLGITSNINEKHTDNERFAKLQQLVANIPWGHNILIITKIKNLEEALFYIQKTKENNWSRDVLALQIKSDLYKRQGGAITNFTNTLPAPNSDLAKQTLKDPYIFDFLQLTEDYKERDIENQLTQHITKFLLELGKGFAFVGKQYELQLNEKEYFIDLLFYHIPMQCYVVVELKNKEFEPEYAGKLNFYLSLIDKTLKRPQENPTIGILLCRTKDNLEVEYALQDIHKPMGVSEFQLSVTLPENLKSSLPSVEELEEELKKLNDE
ncbi:MAG TPA: PDDEXK nuclease domain-containing protein [Edaphocola sp.]|nr:PDDEXK nuclease domain-containing protein [Edaphocola sp.]